MAKFIYLYSGPATPMSDRTPEEGAERMAAFSAWMEKAGAALTDGLPFPAGSDGKCTVEIFELLATDPAYCGT